MLTVDRLRELLDYDPETGVFVWRVDKGRSKKGKAAGYIDRRGYRKITIDGAVYAAHRLAWFYVHGEWPGELDHINLNKVDNRIDNLREATRTQNYANRPALRISASGVKGVSWHKKTGKWVAQISASHRKYHLGLFETKGEAAKAYEEAARRHFGEFARVA